MTDPKDKKPEESKVEPEKSSDAKPGPSESNEANGSKASNQDDEDSKPFDFGGLPNRNLKKNLGCG